MYYYPFHFLGNKEFFALSVLIGGLFRCLSVHYWESCSYPTTMLKIFKIGSRFSHLNKFLLLKQRFQVKCQKSKIDLFKPDNYCHAPKYHNHRLNNNADRTLDVIFSRFRGFSFTITISQKPKRSHLVFYLYCY